MSAEARIEGDESGRQLAYWRTRAEQAEEATQARDQLGRLGTWNWGIPDNQITAEGYHQELLGLAPGTVSGTYEGFLACLHPDDRVPLQREIARYRQGYRVVRPDGSVHWIAGHARLQGAVRTETAANGRGRTRHHRPQDNRGKQSRFHALFDAAEDAVLIADDRRYVEANPAAGKVPGLTPSEIVGRSIDEFVEGLPYTGVDAAWVQSRIGEKHGGRIWVESESGQGSMLISHHR